MFINDWAGKKAEAEAKVNDLNRTSSSDDDVVTVDAGEVTKESELHARLLQILTNQKIKRLTRKRTR